MELKFDKTVNPETIAGAFIYNKIYEFVADINAAASPHTPQSIGGRVYTRFKGHLDNMEALMEGKDRDNLDLETRKAIRDQSRIILDTVMTELSGLVDLNENERRYLAYFADIKKASVELVADIIAGRLQRQPSTQTPVIPSSPGPE